MRAALSMQQARSIGLVPALLAGGAKNEDAIVRAQARFSRMRFVDLQGKSAPTRLTELIDGAFAWEQELLPIAESGEKLLVAVGEPERAVAADTLRFLLDRPVDAVLAAPSALRASLERAYGPPEGASADPQQVDSQEGEEAPVVRLVHRTFEEAVASRASDIHIEPFQDRMRVRYRVDGQLRIADEFPRDLHAAVVSHLKVSADLDIAEKRKPQDGRFGIDVSGRSLDVRTSVIPTSHGESIVMRLLDREANLISLADLGMNEASLRWFERLIERPNGIFLVTGPTGSGKTTTLYAALQTLNRPDRKILTVEDPVEYRIGGINQVQVHPRIGLTFARALRAFLRQAPNVVLVGEIRDRETAEVAIQASLTGHLVFSTVHTNDAPSAITRLLDMGVPRFLIATSLQGVLAQRLVRTTCADCRRQAPATALQAEVLGIPVGDPAWSAPGCPACGRSGYAGRVGTFGWLDIDEELRQRLFRGDDPAEFRRAARASGAWVPLAEDALAKAQEGTTSVPEVLRVTQLTAEDEKAEPADLPEQES